MLLFIALLSGIQGVTKTARLRVDGRGLSLQPAGQASFVLEWGEPFVLTERFVHREEVGCWRIWTIERPCGSSVSFSHRAEPPAGQQACWGPQAHASSQGAWDLGLAGEAIYARVQGRAWRKVSPAATE
jgi:hypothetical protein